MNKRYEGVSVSFYIPLWVGMIYNGFIEWATSGMDEPMDATIERVKAGLGHHPSLSCIGRGCGTPVPPPAGLCGIGAGTPVKALQPSSPYQLSA